QVTYLSADRDGLIDLEQLQRSLRPDTILFMTTLANHVTGAIQPLGRIRKILNDAGHPIALMADACEAYARMPIDVKDPAIDLMSVSAHKIHGPQGVGALYVKKGTNIGLIKHGITRLDTLETGGISMAAIAGFAKAVELAFTDLPGKIKYLKELRDHLLERIESSIPHTMLNGPRGESRISHNLNVSFSYIEGEAIMMMLDLNGILVNTGSACASQGLKANYVLMALGRTHEESHGSIKFTLSRYNTREEIDYTVDQLAAITTELRSRSPLYNKE
ncbi:MAG: aminotransferase class V-fold PLP-dependent enzyme, partial [Candidatus Cloacimonetes bacterium]|nr:aminotransferase class V-fold PLP-dependent enzyme [Candidatus Cloacimonadota bacterium]